MPFPVILAFGQALFAILLTVMAVFIILLVLVQRGRGGGLAGALGGMGGSSAFGAKAGDVFTRITIIAAAVWILLCIAATRWGGDAGSRINVTSGGSPTSDAALLPGEAEDVAGEAEADAAGAAGSSSEDSADAPATAGDAADASSPAPAEATPSDDDKPAAE